MPRQKVSAPSRRRRMSLDIPSYGTSPVTALIRTWPFLLRRFSIVASSLFQPYGQPEAHRGPRKERISKSHNGCGARPIKNAASVPPIGFLNSSFQVGKRAVYEVIVLFTRIATNHPLLVVVTHHFRGHRHVG